MEKAWKRGRSVVGMGFESPYVPQRRPSHETSIPYQPGRGGVCGGPRAVWGNGRSVAVGGGIGDGTWGSGRTDLARGHGAHEAITARAPRCACGGGDTRGGGAGCRRCGTKSCSRKVSKASHDAFRGGRGEAMRLQCPGGREPLSARRGTQPAPGQLLARTSGTLGLRGSARLV